MPGEMDALCDDTLTPVGSYEMIYASNPQTNVRTKHITP